MRILQLTVHFAPNVGGVETHLTDLVNELLRRRIEVVVLAYRPLTTKTSWQMFESLERLKIIRIPWLPGFFYSLVKNPMLEFLYLLPGLFISTPYVILANKPDVIHAHGLVAGFIGTFWGKAFGKRVVVSTHSIYHFPKSGFYRNFTKAIFERCDTVLTLSRQSAEEVRSLGIKSSKVKTFTYWVDLNKFKPIKDAKKKLMWEKKFVVLFVGRLVAEKGIYELLRATKLLKKEITIAVAGNGPVEEDVKNASKLNHNIIYLGKVDQDNLPLYYSASDLVIVPSVHEEGFGRVILESLACGTPVVAANRGAIPEALDESVGKLIKVSPTNIKKTLEYFYSNPDKLRHLSPRARKFAEANYSSVNINQITVSYE